MRGIYKDVVADSSINLGAQIAAAARSNGLTNDQVMRMVLNVQRNYAAKKGTPLALSQAEAAVLQRLQAVGQVNADYPEEPFGQRLVPNAQVDFGEAGNQDELQNFGGRDAQGNIKDVDQQLKEKQNAEGRVDPNVIKRSRWDKAKGEFVTDEFYAADGVPIPASFQEAAKDKDFGVQVPNQFAPAQQVMREELGRLQSGIDKYGADAFPGAASVAGALEDQLYGARGAEQALAREMVAQDRDGLATDEIRRRADVQLNREFGMEGGFGGTQRAMPIDAFKVREQEILGELGAIRQNRDAVEANNWRAQAEANVIGERFVEGGAGARADQAFENIGRISQIGHAKNGSDFAVSNNPVDRGTAIPNALPLNLPDQYNSPVTDNRFAGPLQRQQQWLVDNAPGFQGDEVVRDVAIGRQLRDAQAAIEGIRFNGQNVDLGSRGIRNLDDLEAAAQQVIQLGQDNGGRFFDFQDGKNVFISNPGINEVLQKGGMNPNARAGLAAGLFQVEAANRNPANASNKARFKKGKEQVDGEEMGGRRLVRIKGTDGDEFRVVRAPNKVVNFGGDAPGVGGGMVEIARLAGEKIGGKEVRGQLQALDGRQGNSTPLNADELKDARMPLIGGVAGNDIPRAAFVRGPAVNMTDGERIQEFGPINGEIANRVVRRFNEAGGYDGKSAPRLVERQRNEDPGPARQMATDPWTQPMGTGPGFTQVSGRPTAPRPQLALPYGTQTSGATQGPTRPLTTELKNELAALSSGYSEQGPRPSANFSDPGIQPDGPSASPRRIRQEADYRQSVRNLGRVRKFGRNSAIAGGAVAGLAGIDGLINGERNKREEAQY